MTIKEFKEYLNQFPDNMEILETRCSDYGLMELNSWEVIKARTMVKDVPRPFNWFQRVYDNGEVSWTAYGSGIPSEVKEYLHYQGN